MPFPARVPYVNIFEVFVLHVAFALTPNQPKQTRFIVYMYTTIVCKFVYSFVPKQALVL